MLTYQKYPLDHGEDFKYKKLHKLLHMLMDARKEYGEDHQIYGNVLRNVSTVFVGVITGQMSVEISPSELYHYFEEHHKPDVKNILKYYQFVTSQDAKLTEQFVVPSDIRLDYGNPAKTSRPYLYEEIEKFMYDYRGALYSEEEIKMMSELFTNDTVQKLIPENSPISGRLRDIRNKFGKDIM